jgi:hypothetical protein
MELVPLAVIFGNAPRWIDLVRQEVLAITAASSQLALDPDDVAGLERAVGARDLEIIVGGGGAPRGRPAGPTGPIGPTGRSS